MTNSSRHSPRCPTATGGTHPYHHRLHAGRLTGPELRMWAANRWYYQCMLPVKDAAIISNCPLPDIRRAGLPRIVYHDGPEEGTGGREYWLRLCEALGLDREEVLGQRHVVPGVRFAVDAYVAFARTRERYPKPCMHGWGAWQLTIAPDGTVLPCPAAYVLPGLGLENVTRRPLAEIWYESRSFNAFRGTDWMREPCRTCERRGEDHGGCRCQAFLLTGDAANADPVCSVSPHHDVVTAALATTSDALTMRVAR